MLFYSSFENGMLEGETNARLLSARDPGKRANLELMTFVSEGPGHNAGGQIEGRGWIGEHALCVKGVHNSDKPGFGSTVIYDGLSLHITPETVLSYVIFPDIPDGVFDFDYTSHYLSLDLRFTDGTYLSDLHAIDQNGHPVTAMAQGQTASLFTQEWNYIRCAVGEFAAGRTAESILVTYDKPENGREILAYIDEIRLYDRKMPEYATAADYVLTTRGTMNTVEISRGLMFPAVCVPNAFNFWAPSTYIDRNFYDYQAAAIGQFGCTHQSSYHLIDHGVLHFMPNVMVTEPDCNNIAYPQRMSSFSHETETAKAHEYAVTFDKSTPAAGVRVELTPTDHAAVVRVTYPADALNRGLIFDSVNDSGLVDAKGSILLDGKCFSAVVDYRFAQLTAGASLLYVYGEFDIEPEKAVFLTEQTGRPFGLISFPAGTKTVTMRLATSYLSVEQAKHNLELEVGGASYEEIRGRAKKLWNEIFSAVTVSGATEAQKISLYSNLYRMYAYPTNYSENTGTWEQPRIVHCSPYQSENDRPVAVDGQTYTSNGFWDTYRTAWPAYALLTPEKDAALLDGILAHYRETGWIGRWLNPGAVNCMVGTSYDVVFADAAVKGVDFDYQTACDASVRSADARAFGEYGRTDTEHAPFCGFTPDSVSWSLENAISDCAVGKLCGLCGREAEEAYFLRHRAKFYANVFDRDLGFFVQKNNGGHFIANRMNFHPMKWAYGYVETNAWGIAFAATHDASGLCGLYGGRIALAQKLDALFAAKPLHFRDDGSWQHEMIEARDIRLGQYQHSNQPAHHIIYMYNCAGEAYKTQYYTRNVLDRLYVGSEIGQGYIGDDDNGEQSAWYVLSALGFYPMNAGSDTYMITSPLFREAVLHRSSGDVVIRTINNRPGNVYIRSMTVDGKPHRQCWIRHTDLVSAHEIIFELSDTPTAWGCRAEDLPDALTPDGAVPAPLADYTSDAQTVCRLADGTEADASLLTDDSSATAPSYDLSGAVLTFDVGSVRKIEMYTLSAGKSPEDVPGAWMLSGSRDGEHWTELDRVAGKMFPWAECVYPFLPRETGEFRYYRFAFDKVRNRVLTISEIELLGERDQKKS